jgi:hypothetical protein
LFEEDAAHLFVAVSERVDCNTGGEVQVLSVVQIVQVAALAFVEHGRWANVGGHHEGLV